MQPPEYGNEMLHPSSPPPQTQLNNADDPPQTQLNNADDGGRTDPNQEELHTGNPCTDIMQVLDLSNAFTSDMVFNGREELQKWIRDTGKSVGTVVVVKRSDVGVSGICSRVTFCCERSGYYRLNQGGKNIKETSRRTGTKKCGCPFLIKGIRLQSADQAMDQWKVKVECGTHNHPIAENFEGHSYAARLTSSEKEILQELSVSGVRPRDVLKVIKQRDDKNISTMSTIYNARAKMRTSEKAGRSQMQQLLHKLAEHKYMEWHRFESDTDKVRDIFWAHPESIQLGRCFPSVFLMDCTYKTNRYRMPLLEIVGVTSTCLTFTFAHVYMEAEKEENYIWALQCMKQALGIHIQLSVVVTDRELALMNAIRHVFPDARNFLCRFHISRNLMAKCKKFFEDKVKWTSFISGWNDLVINSSSVEDYEKRLALFERSLLDYPSVLSYVKESWLTPYKESFVAAWTDNVIHFGNNTTNRAESAHAQLKRHLGTSLGTFDSSWNAINGLLLLQHTQIKASFETSLCTVMHMFRPKIFKDLRGFISRDALNIILMEVERSESVGHDVEACGCVIRRKHGLPCAHEITQYKLEGRAIPLSCVHAHWTKLSSVPNATTLNKLDYIPEFQVFAKRFEGATPDLQLDLLKKLKEISTPSATSLMEPDVKANVKGRPSGRFGKRHAKADSSTKRDPSEFEHVIAAETSSKKLPAKRSYHTRHAPPSRYMVEFPSGFRPFIEEITDVYGDGNCGFRAVAIQIGRAEEEWVQVRSDLVTELLFHREEYEKVLQQHGRVDALIKALEYFETPAGVEYWMTMPDCGHIIASCYDAIVVLLSATQCLTFLPLWSSALPKDAHRYIFIGFVDGSHFVRLRLQENCPLPPIACNWYRHHHPRAEEWRTPYIHRIEKFLQIVDRRVVAVRENPIMVDSE